MALVTKTVATYMFIRHNNGGRKNPGMEDFSTIFQKEGVKVKPVAKT
jgi:hypothetical protein